MTNEHHTELSLESRHWLLAWARQNISALLNNKAPPDVKPLNAEVTQPRACFVSLHTKAGALRGCIGTFDDSPPLFKNIAEMAIAAATHDYRFLPLKADELDDCVIEISALTPRVPIAPENVIIGEHGLWIQRGSRSGVLLPQVPVSQGWDRETFLAHTCIKAGLPQSAWQQPDTILQSFRAEVFSEA
ncbi:MAG: AmmeMemoRadiSam system protein A [Deltaproteobacteria bacterium]|nr:AmmeMemoRadiSam system protein A [Deltaproteobacteria bacterium]